MNERLALAIGHVYIYETYPEQWTMLLLSITNISNPTERLHQQIPGIQCHS